MKEEPGNTSEATAVELAAARKLSRWLDAEFRLPGTNFRFGLDPLIGLIPGLGDVVSLAISTFPILAARRLGLPKITIVRLIMNVGVDALVGAIPVIGDVYDFVFKANLRNLGIIERAVAKRDERKDGPPGPDAAT